jgi:hypothetical protein
MSDGAKIALAVIGVGVVGYLVLSKSSATPAPKASSASSTATAWTSGIAGIVSLFKPSAPNSAPANAPLAGISDPGFDSRDISSINEFRAEDTTTLTDSQRDAAIFG